MTIDDFYESLARGVLGQHSSDEGALALMIVLHTHHLHLSAPVLDDCPGVDELPAITQRHAAGVISCVWPDRSDSMRTDYRFWHRQFIERTPYEVLDAIPPGSDWMTRVRDTNERLLSSPLVRAMEPEDP